MVKEVTLEEALETVAAYREPWSTTLCCAPASGSHSRSVSSRRSRRGNL